MFTGIVDHCGTIKEIRREPERMTLLIECEFKDLAEGESIAVDGVCLTAVDPKPGMFECHISPETLNCTLISTYLAGRRVNLERSLRLSDRMGGHWVTGHVDGYTRVLDRSNRGDFVFFLFSLPPSGKRYIGKKGSVALNGVSLTVNEVAASESKFSIMLVPHTLERTNLHTLEVGHSVNIEFDWMAKLILRDLDRARAATEENLS